MIQFNKKFEKSFTFLNKLKNLLKELNLPSKKINNKSCFLFKSNYFFKIFSNTLRERNREWERRENNLDFNLTR